MTDAQVNPHHVRLPDPTRRAKGTPSGRPIRAGERTYLLAWPGLARCLTPTRNRLYDDILIGADVGMDDIRECAMVALELNYTLDFAEFRAIVAAVPPAELAQAVVDAVLVHDAAPEEKNYTNWARSALIANGLDPAKVDARDLPHVLRQLVATGRAMACSDFTAAGEYATTRAGLLSMVGPL